MGIKYQPALDGLRAIAVLAVIAYHARVPHSGYGYLGVDVFFVLSGYLITSILAREEAAGGVRLGAFYLRRIRRLYPAMAALVALLLAVGWIQWKGAFIALFYLGDYWPALPGSLSHFWSLAVEEHYYLIWPLLLPLVVRKKRPAVWMLAAYAAAIAWEVWCSTYLPWRLSVRFDGRLAGLILGSALAFLPLTSRVPYVLLAASSVALMLGYTNHHHFAEAATACLILLSQQTTVPFVTRPAFVYIGRISYGMYLYHWPLWWLFAGNDDTTRAILVYASSIAVAALSFHTIEAYFRKPRAIEPRTVPQAA